MDDDELAEIFKTIAEAKPQKLLVICMRDDEESAQVHSWPAGQETCDELLTFAGIFALTRPRAEVPDGN
jgi:hypothetical protein